MSRFVGMKIRAENSKDPVIGVVTSEFKEDGINWLSIDDSFEAKSSEYEEIWDFSGPPVGPFLRLKRK